MENTEKEGVQRGREGSCTHRNNEKSVPMHGYNMPIPREQPFTRVRVQSIDLSPVYNTLTRNNACAVSRLPGLLLKLFPVAPTPRN